MSKPWWLLAVALGIGLVFGGRWVLARRDADARQTQASAAAAKERDQAATTHSEQGRHEYVLEVINLGVTLDKYRQGKLWTALQTGNPYTSLREHDPKKYPWTMFDKLGQSGGRSGDTLENGAGYTVTEWGTPVFNARPPDTSKYAGNPLMPDMEPVRFSVWNGVMK